MSREETVSLDLYHPLPEGNDQYPVEFIESRGAIKLRDEDGRVVVGLTERSDAAIKDTIRKYHKGKVEFRGIDSVELSAYLGKRYGQGSADPANHDAAAENISLDKLANDAPIVNLVNSICIDGIRSGASDIHIEASTSSARVRYRIDGTLKTIQTIDMSRFPAISSRIKIMANLNILERRQPQDGRITVTVGQEKVDFRVSIVPVSGGESIVLRILGKAVAPLTLDELGFPQNQLDVMRRFLKIPHGLVLVTGPTGSGKTTTLNAMLREIVSDELKVITVEDPVEFIVPGANQIQINEQIELGFETILRRVLRQDPNVIMVGEIRDSATAEIAVRAALTGHLVFSTLHTNDAVSVIPRLTNMGVEPYLTAAVLRGAVAQRLVRRLCPECAAKRNATPREARILRKAGIRTRTIRDSAGCEHCSGTGYKGRTVIAETFEMDAGLEEHILANARMSTLASYLRDSGFSSIANEAVRRLAAGETTLREIEREVVLDEEAKDAAL